MKLHKLNRIFILVVAMLIVPSMLTACGKDKIEFTGEYLSKTYNLESDKVTIYLLGDPEELVITDPEDIKALQDSVDFKSWQYVSPGSGYDGIEVYFVQFNKQTTIAMYLKDAYGLLGKGSPDVNGALQSTDAYYNMSESLLQTAKQMVEKYTK